jgi:amino acid adenylation domain-containing protein
MCAARADAPTIAQQADDGPVPLSFPQERMFLLDQLMPGSSAYNVPTLYRVGATLDEHTLRRAFDQVVARHEILRTTVRLIDGEPVQEVNAPAPFELAVTDLRQALDPEGRAREILGELVRLPFDLAHDLLLRAALVHVRDGEDLLLVVLHHMASDHQSGGLLLAELDLAYAAIERGLEPELAPLAVQYSDFARWQRAQLDGEPVQEQIDYWTAQLAGAPERLELPGDRPRPSAQSYRGSWYEARVAAQEAAPLRELANQQGVSLFMVLLAGFKVLLHRYTGVEDLVVGAPVSGRNHEEIAPLLGFFSNTLALRTDLSGDPSFAELLERVRETMLGALAHQELPFEKLVEVLNPERARSHSPIFQVLFGYDVVQSRLRSLAGASAEQVPVPGWESARFEVSIIVHDLPDGALHLNVGYATDVFDSATVERLIGHYQTLLEAAGRDPEQRLSRLPILTARERQRMLSDWNATKQPYERRCLHELFAEQAASSPEAVAVVAEAGRMTYGELERRSNQLAHELIAAGAEPGGLVGMCLERSLELPVAMLAVLKTGAAYVPIDPSYPPQRQELMLADAGVSVLLTEARFLGVASTDGMALVCVDADAERIAGRPAEPPGLSTDSEQRAYVIYTSGSTGRPKGVEITHRSVANLIAHMRERPGLTASDVVANLTTPAFDLSVPDWYLPLTTGARLVIVPREATLDGVELADWLARSGATFVQATPTTWQLLLDASWTGSAALKIVCGGEALPRALAEELLSRCASLWHMYGPTETTVWSSILELASGEGPTPLGGPIANTRFYVLDANRQPVPIGVPGELHIGGDGLALGYHDREELTAEKFVRDPFTPAARARLYRTGDLVRWREGGTLEFLGRIDQQVKLRGFRIELGEVEAVLDGHPDVSAAVAIVREDSPGDQRLIAYVVAAGAGAPDVEQLRRDCKARLPPFMVPSAFVVIEAFPTTANGKLDRRALPAPDGSRPSLEREYAPPETPIEETLAEIWSEVLGVEQVGRHDDFFDLGGHSLLAVKMVSYVQERFGIDVPLHVVFEHSAMGDLAAAIGVELFDDAGEDELAALLKEIEEDGRDDR